LKCLMYMALSVFRANSCSKVSIWSKSILLRPITLWLLRIIQGTSVTRWLAW
jgi:hypothetical protein